MDTGCTFGGILRLLELSATHTAEFAYDFRSRFNIGLNEIGERITYLEAVYLLSILLRDTSSWVQAAESDWDYPVSREWIVSSHIYDLLAAVNSKKKPKPYPTPWLADGAQRMGNKKQSRKSVIERLRMMNPKPEE